MPRRVGRRRIPRGQRSDIAVQPHRAQDLIRRCAELYFVSQSVRLRIPKIGRFVGRRRCERVKIAVAEKKFLRSLWARSSCVRVMNTEKGALRLGNRRQAELL
jgi:hypothetical protein